MRRLAFLILAIVFGQGFSFGQSDNNIDVRFLTAYFTDTTTSKKDVLAVFMVSTKDSSSFPPKVNLPPKCTVFEGGREKVVLLSRQNMTFAFYSNNIEKDNKELYDKIKAYIHWHPLKPQMIITYSLLDLNYDFTKMSLSPVFREKQNDDIRIEKRFEFDVQ